MKGTKSCLVTWYSFCAILLVLYLNVSNTSTSTKESAELLNLNVITSYKDQRLNMIKRA